MYVIGFTEAFAETFPRWSPHFTTIATLGQLWERSSAFTSAPVGRSKFSISSSRFWLRRSVRSIPVRSLTFDPEYLQANLIVEVCGRRKLLHDVRPVLSSGDRDHGRCNMSGDLANPRSRFRKGTLLAVGVTAIIYLVASVLAWCATTGRRTDQQQHGRSVTSRSGRC